MAKQHRVDDTFLMDGAGVPDTTFYIADDSDNTKKLKFQLSGFTTATTRTITVPDASDTMVTLTGTQTLTNKTLTSPAITGMTGMTGIRTVTDTGGAFATPIVLTAADSGKIYLLDDAAGLDFTLPAITSAEVGVTYSFRLITEVTSNSYRITAGAADLLVGHVLIFDKDAATGDTNALISIFRPDVSDDLVITIAGADDTKGSLVGGWLELEALTTTRWFVRGSLIGDGSLATIFS